MAPALAHSGHEETPTVPAPTADEPGSTSDAGATTATNDSDGALQSDHADASDSALSPSEGESSVGATGESTRSSSRSSQPSIVDHSVDDVAGGNPVLDAVKPPATESVKVTPPTEDAFTQEESAPGAAEISNRLDVPVASASIPTGSVPVAEPEAAPRTGVTETPTAGTRAVMQSLTQSVMGRRPQHGRGGEPRKKKKKPYVAPVSPASEEGAALIVRGLTKVYGGTKVVDQVDLTVPAGSFYGIVGPNGAGKTTTLSMVSGLLRPTAGSVQVAGIDALANARDAKKKMGVLPDRFRTFDRLTGRQLLHYYGALRGLSASVVEARANDLARAFDLTSALSRTVADYSAGMTKKVMLAGALIHSPRLLVLDEPFESVDPVSSAVILDILTAYVNGGGTVILSSHGMDLVEKVCSRVAVIVSGQVLAEGTVDEVRGGMPLEQRFVELAGGLGEVEGLEWLHTYSG